jgi:hypothetical protein
VHKRPFELVFTKNTRNPSGSCVLSVITTTQQAGQKRISGDDFRISKTAGGVCEAGA